MRREELESDCCVADTEQHVSCVNVSFTSRLPEPQREEKRGDGLLQEREGGEQLNLLLTNTTTNFSSPPPPSISLFAYSFGSCLLFT